MSSPLHRLVGSLLLTGSLLSCSSDEPVASARPPAAEALRTGQTGRAGQSNSTLGGHTGLDVWGGLQPPDTNQMRDTQQQVQAYRARANQATGADRERYLQMAENLEQQMASMRKP